MIKSSFLPDFMPSINIFRDSWVSVTDLGARGGSNGEWDKVPAYLGRDEQY